MIDIAMVGCAHIHTPDFIKRIQQRPDICVSAVWDHDAERAKWCAAELNATYVHDLDTIWADTHIQAAIICSETDLHEELVSACTRARKHLFVEKPLAPTAPAAYRLAAAIEDAGILFQTGFFRRSLPVYQFLRRQIQQRHFGTITRMSVSFCHAGARRGWFDNEWRWMADAQRAGFGAFGDLGIHALDLMLWLMQSEVACVTASVRTVTQRYGDIDECGEGILLFKDGETGVLAASWIDASNPITFTVNGTEGSAFIANNQLYFQSTHVHGADGIAPWTDLPPALPHAFDAFLDTLLNVGDVPLVDVRDAARCSAVMEALYLGARHGAWVTPHLS